LLALAAFAPLEASLADTVDVSSAIVRFSGSEAGARAGSSIGSALDFFDDGRGAIIIGAPLADPQGLEEAGSNYLFSARSSPGDFALTAATFGVEGVEADEEIGFAIGGGGDVNGDGTGDLIVGGFRSDAGGLFDAGIALVFFGDASRSGFDPSNEADLVIMGQDPEDHLGWAVDISGDFNGDGIEDIVVGAPLGETSLLAPGEVFVFLGGTHLVSGATLNPALANVYFRGEEAGAGCGQALGVGDVNGDGRADLAIGAPGEDWSGRFNAGGVFVFLGRTDWGPADLYRIENDYNLGIMGGFAFDAFGTSVAIVGDMNGDGFDEILVGAPFGTEGGQTYRGRANLFAGRTISSRITLDSRSQSSSTWIGDSGGDLVGAAVGSARDYNSDGRPDLVVGAPGDDPQGRDGAGSAFVFHGQTGVLPPSGTITSFANRQFIGAAAGDELGAAVGGVADFNLDGSTDLVLGAPGVDVGSASSAGRVYLFSGIATLGVAEPPAVMVVREALPNPTRNEVSLVVRSRLSRAGTLSIVDAHGRRVRSLPFTIEAGVDRSIVWDGRDERGVAARPGVYYVRVPGGARGASIVIAR
jgi:hypothetical protein